MTNPFARMGLLRMPGSSVEPGVGYHDLPFPEYADAPSHRKGTAERVAHMAALMDFSGKDGLDIGCSVGGVTFGLQLLGARMVGIDADRAAIRCAREVEEVKRTGAQFESCAVPSPMFSALLEERFDFGVFYSAFMWVAAAEGMEVASAVMQEIADAIPVLWFETAEGPTDGSAGGHTPFKGKGDVRAYLKGFYTSVEDTGIPAKGWYPRTVFLCRH